MGKMVDFLQRDGLVTIKAPPADGEAASSNSPRREAHPQKSGPGCGGKQLIFFEIFSSPEAPKFHLEQGHTKPVFSALEVKWAEPQISPNLTPCSRSLGTSSRRAGTRALADSGAMAPRIQNEKMSFVSMYGALFTFRFSWMR